MTHDLNLDACPRSRVPRSSIICDPEHASPRTDLRGRRVNPDRVAEFKALLDEDVDALPDLICVETHGQLVLADGHHRLAALSELASEHPAELRFESVTVRIIAAPAGQTPLAYAYEIAVQCSAKGPLPLTRQEKRVVVYRLLVEHPRWSDREIARTAGVDHKTVGRARSRGVPHPDDQSSGDGATGSALRTSQGRLSRIARQIARYGDELGVEGSEFDYDDVVSVLASELREQHPQAALDWAAWWQQIWQDITAELRAAA